MRINTTERCNTSNYNLKQLSAIVSGHNGNTEQVLALEGTNFQIALYAPVSRSGRNARKTPQEESAYTAKELAKLKAPIVFTTTQWVHNVAWWDDLAMRDPVAVQIRDLNAKLRFARKHANELFQEHVVCKDAREKDVLAATLKMRNDDITHLENLIKQLTK